MDNPLHQDLVSLIEKRIQSNGYVFTVEFIYRGKRKYTQLFYSQGGSVNRAMIEDDLKKIYPEASLVIFRKSEFAPGNPLIIMREEKECGEKYCRLCEKREKRSKCAYGGAMWDRYTVDDVEDSERAEAASESGITEGAAWTKKSGKNKEGGLNEKGRKSYERENPGSDLKAPSKKVGNPRRASFRARMRGMKKKLTSKKTASDPDSRINKSLRAWNC